MGDADPAQSWLVSLLIVDIMNCSEWNADTLDKIADVLDVYGYDVWGPGDEDCNHE